MTDSKLLLTASSCDHISSVTSFPKYQMFPGQINIFGNLCRAKSLKFSFVVNLP